MVIEWCFSQAVLLAALTPAERWSAAGEPFETSFLSRNWFVFAAVCVLIVLVVAFAVITIRKNESAGQVNDKYFMEYTQARGMSDDECRVLQDMAVAAGLPSHGDILTDEGVFDRAAAELTAQALLRGEDKQAEQLTAEMPQIREKLGFRDRQLTSAAATGKIRVASSRSIPAGRKVYITRRVSRNDGDIEASVLANTDTELLIRPAVVVKVTLGQLWRVRYYFGASIWEFDTTVLSAEGDTLALTHSGEVRFVNRRRFLRVPVRLPAFVAKFPFTRGPSADGKQELAPPEFVEATVTELAGPGLRIEVPFEAGVGERVLVIMRLDQLQRHGPADQQEIVQDIGQVRHSEAIENRCSVAVELTGLSDSDLNKLVLATNAASRNAAQAGEDASASPENSARRVAGDDTDPGGESPEAVAVQEGANA